MVQIFILKIDIIESLRTHNLSITKTHEELNNTIQELEYTNRTLKNKVWNKYYQCGEVNVGVGTPNPIHKLHVKGDTYVTNLLPVDLSI